jgi:fructokinase
VKTIVGLGEILWDLLPSGRQLGGAPANFAYCSHLLGNRALVASRIGDDELGREVQAQLRSAGLSDEFLQVDGTRPTGTVQVEINSEGQPRFQIIQPVAWDFLEWTQKWKSLAQSVDAVCFGSLAQRSPASRATILNFVDSTGPEALRIFDINLRQRFYSDDIILSSLQRANVVKLNHEEVPVLAGILRFSPSHELSLCKQMLEKFDLQLVCITRGGNGSVLVDKNGSSEHQGFNVRVKDTVGAGDAFTAGLTHELLRGASLEKMNDTANRMGAWVASQSGAMPPCPDRGLTAAFSNLSAKSN